MSDETELDAPPEAEESPLLQDLRQKAKEGRRAAAEAEALRREMAFLKAGINPDDTRQSYFVKGYDGDLNPEAIRAAANDAGFLDKPPTPEPTNVMTPEERAAHGDATQMGAGAGAPGDNVDIYAPFRNQDQLRTGEPEDQFGARLAYAIRDAGGEIAMEGPFREFKGDSGVVPRPGTPYVPKP